LAHESDDEVLRSARYRNEQGTVLGRGKRSGHLCRCWGRDISDSGQDIIDCDAGSHCD
jgi:hypothetical protein